MASAEFDTCVMLINCCTSTTTRFSSQIRSQPSFFVDLIIKIDRFSWMIVPFLLPSLSLSCFFFAVPLFITLTNIFYYFSYVDFFPLLFQCLCSMFQYCFAFRRPNTENWEQRLKCYVNVCCTHSNIFFSFQHTCTLFKIWLKTTTIFIINNIA